MTVFIVRPFGTKEGIDFDKVEDELIRPVLTELGILGGTTGEIARAGNIQADMMERLLVADLVIADISIHNANVYYELGVRHALRARPTIMIRCAAHDVPFDIETYRYLEYDKGELPRTRSALKQAIQKTLRSDVIDSPVFQLLPNLKAQDPSTFHAVPQQFREAVVYASSTGRLDVAELALLADETQDRPWRLLGLRMVAQSLFDLKEWPQAQRVLELIRAERPEDVEANTLLGTVYQRLGDLAKSSLALDRLPIADAEARALRARNFKTQWIERWQQGADAQERGRLALSSAKLRQAADEYFAAFQQDLNHYYSGLNALAFYTILLELAQMYPGPWEEQFFDRDEAAQALTQARMHRDRLVSAVALALEAAGEQLKRTGASDDWFDFSVADHRYLTTQDRPGFIRQGYADAAESIDTPFPKEAAAQQLTLYLRLGLFEESTRQALEALSVREGVPDKSAEKKPKNRIIVSTGHRLDQPERQTPRFPPGKEEAARRELAATVSKEIDGVEGTVQGIAGLASGNDILFHEVCKELGVPTRAGLAIPRAAYVRKSVADAGADWVDRFNVLCDELSPHVLSDTEELPPWVADRPDYGVFQRGNIWILEWAFAQPNTDVTLIALWNGQEGDGPGGTADMVRLARQRGAKAVVIDPANLASQPAHK